MITSLPLSNELAVNVCKCMRDVCALQVLALCQCRHSAEQIPQKSEKFHNMDHAWTSDEHYIFLLRDKVILLYFFFAVKATLRGVFVFDMLV